MLRRVHREQLATHLNARIVDDNGRPVLRDAHLSFAGQRGTLNSLVIDGANKQAVEEMRRAFEKLATDAAPVLNIVVSSQRDLRETTKTVDDEIIALALQIVSKI